MKTKALLLLTAASLQAGTAPEEKPVRFFLNSRLRAEAAESAADIDGSSAVLSLRNRFGVELTAPWISFLAEGEHTWILSNTSDYSPFPGGTRSTIGDPDSLDLNRLQVTLGGKDNPARMTLGRQMIAYDDQRFVGSVGWRQNDQTFDAASIQYRPIDSLTLDYAYLDQVNRIFGNNAPLAALERWHSESHLFHAEWKPATGHTLTGFLHLLDFDNAPRFSSDTLGLEWRGTADADIVGWKPSWIITAAHQQDATNNPNDYAAQYLRARLDLARSGWKISTGYEHLGSDDGREAFQFPLGTNHAFNGYADAFLTTPVNGLRDLHAFLETPPDPYGCTHRIALHHFESDNTSQSLGNEIDWSVRRPFGKSVYAQFVAAWLEGDGPQPDVRRVSLELDWIF